MSDTLTRCTPTEWVYRRIRVRHLFWFGICLSRREFTDHLNYRLRNQCCSDWWNEYSRVPPINRVDPSRRKVSLKSRMDCIFPNVSDEDLFGFWSFCFHLSSIHHIVRSSSGMQAFHASLSGIQTLHAFMHDKDSSHGLFFVWNSGFSFVYSCICLSFAFFRD